jgi:hypothetical protein
VAAAEETVPGDPPATVMRTTVVALLSYLLCFLSLLFSHPTDARRIEVYEQRRSAAGGLC